MFTLLATRFRRTRTGSVSRPGRRATTPDPYAAQRRAMQRVQAAELAELGEIAPPSR